MKCKHVTVVIKLEWVQNIAATTLADVNPPISHVFPLAIGPVSTDSGYWSRAHLHVKCVQCGHETWWTSADWRQYPRWLRDAWLRLVDASPQLRAIHEHYRMFQEAVPAPTGVIQ